MKNIDLNNLSNPELRKLYKDLVSYRNIKKNLGRKGASNFLLELENKKRYLVEYSKSLEKDFVLENSIKIFEKIFKEKVKKEDIILKVKENLIGGICVYVDDEVFDLSFLKFAKVLKKKFSL